MLSISPQALDLIRKRNRPIHLDLPPLFQGGCCLGGIRESPTVRFGPPPDFEKSRYVEHSIEGVTVHVPREMHTGERFTIAAGSFLGFRWIFLEGWSAL